MADYNVVSNAEEFEHRFFNMASQLRVAMPGVIQTFDARTQTATVLPAIKMKVNIGGEVEHRELPPVEHVPVVLPFAQTAGLLLTLPVQSKDEVLLIFSDRAIDNFMQLGGIQPPLLTSCSKMASPRSHSLADAICIPGIISNPQAVPDYNTENIEIRDRERKHYFSLGPDGITITDGKASWNMSDGKITVNVTDGIEESGQGEMSRISEGCQTIKGSNINIDCAAKMNRMSGRFEIGDPGTSNIIHGDVSMPEGTVTDKDGVVLNTHVHTGVVQGEQLSKEPQK